MTSDSDSDFGPDSGFDALVTVQPTEPKIPFDFNEEHYSCSIQLTNKTDRIVAYYFLSWSSTILLESPDEDTNVGTILPRSTSSVTLITAVYLLGKEPPEEQAWIHIWACVVKDGVKAEGITRENFWFLTDTETRGLYGIPVVYYMVPAANPVPIKETKKSAAATALTLATPGMSDSEFGPDSEFGSDSDFDDLLKVHPTELNNLFELNEETLCSIQLTNKTHRIVAYRFWPSSSIHMVSPDANTYVGTILPCSTFSVTVKLGKKPPPGNKEWIEIYAYVVKDGVKAEDITIENVYDLIVKEPSGIFRMPVVYYYVPAADPYSAVPEKKEKGYLPDYNNPFQVSYNKEMKRVENSPPPAELVIPSTGGYGSTSRRKTVDTRVKPSFKTFSPKEIQDATNNFNQSIKIGQGGYGKVYKCQLDNWDVAVKILDDKGDQGLKEYIKEMEVLEGMKHENLIRLVGTCFKFRALIYEHLPNGSLEDCLKHRPKELTWEIRTRIVYEICTVLRFLHANKPEPLVHGDLKPHNVLLNANFKVKLADFGLCRYLTQGENSKAFCHTMNACGSAGYMDPDYLGSGKVTPGIDVYSFGKTVVRILTGQHPPDIFREVHVAKKTGSFMTIVDPTVRDWPENVVGILARFALRSTKSDRNSSKFMAEFYSALEMILDDIDN